MVVRLTSVYGAFGAHVLAARLRAEGFDVELRGALHNPYAVTVGEMARVDVYVPADQAEEASVVLLAGEVDEVLDLDCAPRRRRIPRAVVVGAALGVFVLTVVEVLTR